MTNLKSELPIIQDLDLHDDVGIFHFWGLKLQYTDCLIIHSNIGFLIIGVRFTISPISTEACFCCLSQGLF